ncbi:MAG TPA: ABC transporter permease [Acidimicrobiales bacterium]|jgi:peptide/nickel transport system permease protein|nr:ABC transporter permease [Acidimicrobiales bacterium]
MARFLLRRISFGIVVMWVVATAVFILYFVAPHDPARLIAGRQATALTLNDVRARLGMNLPLIDQYWHYITRLLRGDLGYSYVNAEPVSTIIGQDLPVTASVAGGGAVLWLLIGVSSGVLASIRPRSVADRATTGFALLFYSMPTFLLGELLLLVLFYRLHLAGFNFFPGGGYVAITADPYGWFQHMILPWITIALVTAATYSRLTRGAMLDVLGEDYIRTARAKGLSERRVVFRHGLRAALTPVVTQFGIDLGTLLGGIIVTETVFSLPGLGQQIVNSIDRQDLPVIIGLVLLASAFIVVANIVVDALYAVLDPRVRLS